MNSRYPRSLRSTHKQGDSPPGSTSYGQRSTPPHRHGARGYDLRPKPITLPVGTCVRTTGDNTAFPVSSKEGGAQWNQGTGSRPLRMERGWMRRRSHDSRVATCVDGARRSDVRSCRPMIGGETACSNRSLGRVRVTVSKPTHRSAANTPPDGRRRAVPTHGHPTTFAFACPMSFALRSLSAPTRPCLTRNGCDVASGTHDDSRMRTTNGCLSARLS